MDSIDQSLILRFASLLHDIGKFWQGTGEKGSHQELSAKFVRQYLPESLEKASFLAGHHDPSQYMGEEYKLLKTLVVADWLSSGERREIGEGEEGRRKETPMESLFPKISLSIDENKKIIKKYYPPQPLSLAGDFFPLERNEIKADLIEYYKKLWNDFVAEIEKIKSLDHESYFTTLYYLLKKYMSFIPSAVWKSEPDISLFDHSKITCAIAECLYKNADETYLDNIIAAMNKMFHNGTLTENEESALNEEKFLLIGGDISGVQKFIYSITAKGAAKALKGRSFYLQLLGDAIAKYILRELGLSVANLLYSAGGHFYIVAPMGSKTDNIYENIEKILMEIHDGELYLATAEIPVKAIDFIGENFVKKWDEIGERLGEAKKKKFSRILNYELFFPKEEFKGVCHSCGMPTPYELIEEEGVAKCVLCKSFEELTEKIARKGEIKARYIIQTIPTGFEREGTWEWNLSRFGIRYDLVDTLRDINLNKSIVYKLNDTNFIENIQGKSASFGFTFLFQTPLMELSNMAKNSDGIKKWGVLRGDVDNLGKIFSEGLKNATISRISTLSSMLSFFFNGYINNICKEYKDNIYGIYSGGDDFFIVGSWSTLPDLAKRIYGDFRKFTGENPCVTLSIGISVAPGEKYPIYKVADTSGSALEKAKEIDKDKDAITFLDMPIKWDKFNGDVEKFKEKLQKFIANKPRGILQKLYSVYAMYAVTRKEKGAEMAKYDGRHARWRWMLTYLMARLKTGHEEKEEIKMMFMKNIDYSPVVIKWVEYLTRRGEKNE